jgi:hypothetical protein
MPKNEWGWMRPLIQFERGIENQADESRGQKEDLHATLAKMHVKNRWEEDSSSTLQRGHREFFAGIWKMVFSLVLVGRRFQAIFQRNKMSLALSLSFHRAFQVLESKGEMVELVLILLINLWAELEEKQPSEEGVQRKAGEEFWLMGIFWISLTQEEVNKEMRRGRFQEPFEIKSETLSSGKGVLLKGFDWGEKRGMVGIQEEFQTERAENLWILWQAPRAMIGFDFWMPFQSQEGEEWEEGERKEPDLRYLPESWATQGESEPVSSFQPSLEMRARLTSLVFLKLRPPRDFGVQMEFQDFKVRFLDFEGGNPHQKFLKTLSSWLQMLFGRRKVLMA